MSDEQMVLRRATGRIIDPDRRLDIYKGWIKAPESFFEKYGKLFVNEPKVGKEKDSPIRTITEWADKSRAAEFAEIRKANRISAKREMEEFMAADKIAAREELKESSEPEAEPEEPVEEEAPVVVKGPELLPADKAVWKGAKKLATKKK